MNSFTLRALHSLNQNFASAAGQASGSNAGHRFLASLPIFLLTFVFSFTAWQGVDAQSTAGPFSPSSNSNNDGVASQANMYSSNNSYATFDSGNDDVRLYDFGITGIPYGSSIAGIGVSIEGYRDAGSSRDVEIELSWDAGASWTGMDIASPDFGTSETTISAGGSSDTWGRTWLVTEFSNANFRLRIGVTGGGDNLYVDHVQLTVYYNLPTSPYTLSTGGTYSFTVPAGVTAMTVKLWGAGAGGSNRNGAAGGGGGGAYTEANLTGLTPGATMTITVGTGGAAGSPTASPGNRSTVVVGATTIHANGGLSVNNS